MSVKLEEVVQFLSLVYPPSLEKCEILAVDERSSSVLWKVSSIDIRPGGTISGPTMMALADLAMYVAILGEIGLVGLAVTTNMNINFLRKPTGGLNLRAECRLIKVGKVLVVGEVWIYSVDSEDPVAHVTGTYSIPPTREAE
ncbi:PaaI family thioesterase [Acinetobacter cumulans]|uniref:PaaI family thioesterase n=1 Tax=Acinetobacter cumulans TaxID=2136182 RepID=A0ABX9U9V2_9GAMM|nr:MULTISPECIES: PaaI family thioesterase [Acinetobacter]NWK75238.1 PaaI family thioesterase [Acinetobacter sp. SwsAc6]RLL49094.1 PaaI family thioesterase [Acinetobacter cumulans]